MAVSFTASHSHTSAILTVILWLALSTTMANLAAAVLALALPLFADAYTWQFKSQPTQCGNVSISVSGGGSPPYEVLIIPVGSSPLPNNIEARKIQDQTGFTSSDISFKLNFPADSQFVAVVRGTPNRFRHIPTPKI
jgi:hypothetical protein